MPPQPHRNGSQFAGDDSTRVLAPVGKGDDATQILTRFNWMLDETTRRHAERIEEYRLEQSRQACQREGHTFTVVLGPGRGWCIHCGDVPPTEPTAVLPVTPAQPQPINDGEPYNDHPWCRKKMMSIGLLFGAGVLVGVPLGMVLLFVILMTKVAM